MTSVEDLTCPPAEKLKAIEEAKNLLRKAEFDVVDEAMEQAGDNKTLAAEFLGISRYALSRRLHSMQKEAGR